MNYNNVGILIAVRMKSTRLPRKALRNIVERPLITHLIERMKRVKKKNKIILCTSTHIDDKVLLDIADREGIFKYAGSELDVMKRFIDASEYYNLDTIVRVTGDNPLTDPENIDRMIDVYYEGKYDFVKSEHLPLGVNAEVVSLSALKKAHDMAVDTEFTEYMTSYLKRPDIFKTKVIVNNDIFFKNRSKIRLTVDFEEDIQVMDKIYAALYKGDPNFGIKEALSFLDSNPELLEINANMLETPLPKIRFKGEREYDKKLVAIIDDFNTDTGRLINEINKLKKFDLIGFIYCGADFQYTLIEGIPILGDCFNLKQIVFKADYFFVHIKGSTLSREISTMMIDMGLEQIFL